MNAPQSGVSVARVPLSAVDAHPSNVRRDLGDLRALTQSIAQFGVMQPVTVERAGVRFRLRDGHRRAAAARLAGLTRIPAVVHSVRLDDDEWLTQAAHANTRRRDLAAEDRRHTVRLMRAAGMSWASVAEAFDASTTTVQAWLRDPVVTRAGEDSAAVPPLAAAADVGRVPGRASVTSVQTQRPSPREVRRPGRRPVRVSALLGVVDAWQDAIDDPSTAPGHRDGLVRAVADVRALLDPPDAGVVTAASRPGPRPPWAGAAAARGGLPQRPGPAPGRVRGPGSAPVTPAVTPAEAIERHSPAAPPLATPD